MKKIISCTILLFVLCGALAVADMSPSKVVGLVQVRNEEPIIESCLRCLAYYTDSIVLLDDASDDNTRDVVKRLASELHIEKVITNSRSAWQKTLENDNRQKLLEAGRAVGGTHFILIDADEVFSANCLKNGYLKSKILYLQPGMVLRVPCMNVWDGLTHYRNDRWCNPRQSRWLKPIAFCDDGICSYTNNTPIYGGPAKVIHGLRVPANLSKSVDVFERIPCVLIHFKYANLDAITIKKDWYMCLEFIRAQEKLDNPHYNAQIINGIYDKKEFACLVPDANQMVLRAVNSEWFAYPKIDFSCFTIINNQQHHEIMKWFAVYGKDYFRYLNLRITHSGK